MQGILNGQYQYQCGQLPIDDMMFSRSLTNIFAAWILHLRKTRWYRPRMKPEREIIQSADYILGRTTWDRAHTYAINPRAKYFSCSRVLRPPFYETRWNVDKMERHSIYVGNGYYALKGLHFVLQALALLRNEYPDVKLYVAGYEPYRADDKRSVLKKGYAAYLKKLVEDLKLQDHVIFTGPLKAQAVAERLSLVNVYVLASVAENSPNTLGEAMLVGTPCVASYVGGVPDMVTDGEEALLFRNDDPALMAWQIKQVFDRDDLACRLSENGQKRARVTHDPQRNARQLMEAYRTILQDEEHEI
jgi:glycosyltransferase involved in cell wall biosynthesis